MRESGGISICPCGWSVSIYRFNHPHALAFFDFDKDNFFNYCSFLDHLKNETKKLWKLAKGTDCKSCQRKHDQL